MLRGVRIASPWLRFFYKHMLLDSNHPPMLQSAAWSIQQIHCRDGDLINISRRSRTSARAELITNGQTFLNPLRAAALGGFGCWFLGLNDCFENNRSNHCTVDFPCQNWKPDGQPSMLSIQPMPTAMNAVTADHLVSFGTGRNAVDAVRRGLTVMALASAVQS